MNGIGLTPGDQFSFMIKEDKDKRFKYHGGNQI
jgi:hypothetical protein